MSVAATTMARRHRVAGRTIAAAALLASVGAAAAGSADVAVLSSLAGLSALAVGPRLARQHSGDVAQDFLRVAALRAGTAERVEGAVAAVLEEIVRPGHAATATAIIRRGDGGLTDAYSWIDGRLHHDELLWQPQLTALASGQAEGLRPRLPPRLGQPRRWLVRPIVGAGEVRGALVAVDPRLDCAQWLDSAMAVVGTHLGAVVVGQRFSERLERGFVATIEALIGALEAKDAYTAGHSGRVAAYALAVAAELNLPEAVLDDLRTGAVLHDIGKIGVGDTVLFKPGRLSDAEFDQIKDHPRRGARIIDAFNRSATVLAIVFHHHERYDGRGYPAGLRGVDIPLAARIVNVADAYDAMTTNRPYGSTRTPEEALGELRRGAGTQFDPQVVVALERARLNGRI